MLLTICINFDIVVIWNFISGRSVSTADPPARVTALCRSVTYNPAGAAGHDTSHEYFTSFTYLTVAIPSCKGSLGDLALQPLLHRHSVGSL